MTARTRATSRRKRFLQNLALFFASVLMALLLAEWLLPLFITIEKSTVVYDPVLGLRGRPNVTTVWTREIEDKPLTVKTNSRGFHDVEHDPDKPAGVHRVLFVGDSYTEAYQVPLRENFVRRLQGRYDADRDMPTVEHINSGLHTWGLGAYYLYIKHKAMEWNPDTVVVCLYMGNDLHDNYYGTGSASLPRFSLEDGALKHYPPPDYSFKLWVRDNVAGRSDLVRFLWMRGIGRSRTVFNLARRQGLVGTPEIAARKLEGAGLAEITGIAEKQFLEMHAFLKARGARLVVFIIPDPRRVNALAGKTDNIGIPITQEHAEYYTNAVTRGLRDAGIPYVYPLEAFVGQVRGGREIYLHGGGHFSSYGHARAAAALATPLKTEILHTAAQNQE